MSEQPQEQPQEVVAAGAAGFAHDAAVRIVEDQPVGESSPSKDGRSGVE